MGIVNRCSTFKLSRALCAAIMLFSWLAISNHCALGSLMKNVSSPQAHASCCGRNTSQERGKAPGSDTRECCKTLHALPAPTPAKVVLPAAQPLTIPQVWALMDEVLHAPPVRRLVVMDSGPPLAWSFAEEVLQRSLPSLAPPVSA
jgi:hypothetical protein